MNVILSLTISSLAIFGLVVIPFLGVWVAHLNVLFGIVIPYIAVIIFFLGMIYRVVKWAKSPVPFRIPTTCSQQKSLPWIKYTYVDKLDNPSTRLGVLRSSSSAPFSEIQGCNSAQGKMSDTHLLSGSGLGPWRFTIVFWLL